MACEKCWNDAYMRSRWNGLSQADNYRLLLEDRKDNPCGPEYESKNYFADGGLGNPARVEVEEGTNG